MDNTRTTVVRNRPSVVGWIALLLSIAALALSWVAYNRTGKDLEDSVAEQIRKAGATTQQAGQDANKATENAADKVEQGLDTGPDGVDDGAQ